MRQAVAVGGTLMIVGALWVGADAATGTPGRVREAALLAPSATSPAPSITAGTTTPPRASGHANRATPRPTPAPSLKTLVPTPTPSKTSPRVTPTNRTTRANPPKPTQTTSSPRPSATRTTAPAPTRSNGISTSPDAFPWKQLAACESGGDWHINTGNGYYGGLQFTIQTWLAFGGGDYASRADLASPQQQVLVAIKTQAAQGWGAWPSCSERIGL